MRLNPTLLITLAAAAAVIDLTAKETDSPGHVTAPSKELRKRLDLDPHYMKAVLVNGFPILGSEKVSDYALLEAAHWISKMLEGRDDVRLALISEKVRYGIMAADEYTTDLPEHSDLTPAAFWDKRARGLGSTPHRPCVSCGEENLLRYKGDPYDEESILIHEFAHAFHLQGLNIADPKWEQKLVACYNKAMAEGLWKGKYTASNKEEYWAEGVQSFFDTNRKPDHDHNHVDTRIELKEYDSRLHDLIADTFANTDWKYTRPEVRAGKGHLKGYDPTTAPVFHWSKKVTEAWAQHQKAERELPKLESLPLTALEGAKSPKSRQRVRFLIKNETDKPARLFWIDFEGKRVPQGWIRNGWDSERHSFAGHLFLVTDAKEKPLAVFAAPGKRSGELFVEWNSQPFLLHPATTSYSTNTLPPLSPPHE